MMFDELFQMVQQSGQQAVVENDQVPNEHNQDVLREAQSAVFTGLSNLDGPDQANGLVESVQTGSADSHPAVQQISQNFMGSITEKFGINRGAASSIASALIPLIISKVVGRMNQQGSAGGFDLGGLLAGLTGASPAVNTHTQNSNLGGKISSIGSKFGLDKDKDGDIDLSDLSKMF